MPYPWSVNDVLTASDLNAAIGTGIVSTGLGAWTSYTPTWTSTGTAPALGNAVNGSGYWQAGKLVVARIKITFGSTSTYGTGTYAFGLPVTASGNSVATFGMACECLDLSASTRVLRFPLIETTTTIRPMDTSGTIIGQTVPFTWANGDRFTAVIAYEAA